MAIATLKIFAHITQGGEINIMSHNELFTGGGWVAGFSVGVLGVVIIVWLLVSAILQHGGRGRGRSE